MGFVCPSWLSFILYNPLRKALTDREGVLQESEVSLNSAVLEIGAGNGFFTEVLAGRAGKVYAVELQEGMIRKLRKRTAHYGDKVQILRCDIAACAIGEDLADVCLMYYSFHEVKDKPGAAQNIAGALRAGGVLSVYEPSVEVGGSAMRETVALFERIGFARVEERAGLFTRFAKLRKNV
ncbi:MAG: class I SAM-dependent methyltransferase [Nitrospirae bacterium]|nr:class I SAM-dependent methyltransferase [Nitrospirota bacterium]